MHSTVARARRDIVPFSQRKNHCSRRRREGSCNCTKARKGQACQSCKRWVKENDCIKKYDCGWCHTECNTKEVEAQRGLPMIREEYNEVHYTDVYLQLEGNNVLSPVPLLLTYTDEPRHITQESSKEHDSDDPRLITQETKMDSDTPTQFISHGPAIVTPAKRNPVEEDDQSTGARVRRKLFHGQEEEEEKEQASDKQETDEQQSILDYEPAIGEVFAVNALAGCGKTTTISLLCNKYNKDESNSLLYLVFNKKNEKEVSISNKFPKERMETRTTHSCILRHYFGTDNMKNVDSSSSRHDLEYIKNHAGLYSDCKSIFPDLEAKKKKAFDRIVQTVASFVRKTIEIFQSSDARQVEQSHVFGRARQAGSERTKWKRKIAVTHYVRWAQTVFDHSYQLCKDVQSGRMQQKVKITFDTYLKAAELDRFVLPQNVIFIDEAQDMTPCQASLFWGEHQRRGKIIYLFGDQYQQLYRFRGARNSFVIMLRKCKEKMSLTGSFRFGHNIAAYASYTLKAIGATDLVQGKAKNEGRVQRAGRVNPYKSLVALCRTNQGVFEYLLEKRPRRWSSLGFQLPPEKVKKFAIELEDFLWERTSVFTYKKEDFTSPEEISEYAEDEGDSDLLRYFNLLSYLKKKETSMESFFKEIRASYRSLDGKSPDHYKDRVVVDTVHKAKGLEFNNVLIYDDFNFGVIKKAAHLNQDVSTDEANVLYVATSRAKECLLLTDEAYEFFEYLKKAFGSIPEIQSMPENLSGAREQLLSTWKKLKESETTINCLNDIPWPPKDSLGFDRQMTELEYRSYAKALILIYHPDKFKQNFHQRCSSKEIYDEVEAEMAKIFREANRLKQQEWGWEVELYEDD